MTPTPKSAPRLTLLQLVAATYFIVSGGPYGLEELLAKSGYGLALVVLVVTPLLWSLPTALMVGELASAIPDEGGFYIWVRRALGPFWGFQEAWLSLLASVFEMALYPTLFSLYLGRLVPALGQGMPGLAVGVGMIAACAAWNLRGGAAVGTGSIWLGAALLAPFAVLAALALCGAAPAASAQAKAPAGGSVWAGLFVAMWNFTGWDNAATFAGEVDRPQRTYPLGILLTVALVTVGYLIPVAAAQRGGLDPSGWTTGSWVTAGLSIGGPWLGRALIAGGMISAVGSFNSLLLSYSRLPLVLAEDGWLPRWLAARTEGSGAPAAAVLCCSLGYASCLGLGFGRLVQLDILLYGASLSLEFAALWALRLREPTLARPFRVPGGLWCAAGLGIAPMALLGMALVAAAQEPGAGLTLWLSAALMLAGLPVFWLAARGRRGVPVPG